MWIITVHTKNNITMFEFDTEKEAKVTFERTQGCKFLTQVIYFNDDYLVKSTQHIYRRNSSKIAFTSIGSKGYL